MRAWNKKNKPKFITKAKYKHEFGIISCRKMKEKEYFWDWEKDRYIKDFRIIVISPYSYCKYTGF